MVMIITHNHDVVAVSAIKPGDKFSLAIGCDNADLEETRVVLALNELVELQRQIAMLITAAIPPKPHEWDGRWDWCFRDDDNNDED